MNSCQTLTLLAIAALATRGIAGPFVLPEGLPEASRKRFERFESFRIKGVCGDSDLDRLATYGVNTVRGYTFPDPEETRAKLDHAQRLGMKMIIGEWMPHHGPNKTKEGHVWNFDYHAKGDGMIAQLIRKVEAVGDHPAILMWSLGNEVHLDEPYLKVVNRMSLEIHKRFPHHLTSLTMVNAKADAIAAVKEHAPDIDVLGIQSYSRGAVRGAIKKTAELWGKPFYMSEFNGNGPWNFKNTEWDVPLDEPVANKVRDLRDCYAAIDSSPLCLGSTVFLWGHFAVNDRPTYFSLLLDPDPTGKQKRVDLSKHLITPQAEVMIRHFTGAEIKGNRAPLISKMEFEGGLGSRTVKPGESLRVKIDATDPDGDPVSFVTWILKSKVRETTAYSGPFPQAAADLINIQCPGEEGAYLVMIYAIDERGGGSATVLPFLVNKDEPANPETSKPQ